MKTYHKALLVAVGALAGALLNRWRGWGGAPVGIVLRRLSVAALPGLFAASFDWRWGLVVALASYPGAIVGHGRYFSIGRGPYPDREDNWPGEMVSLFIPPSQRYTARFDAIALAITGAVWILPLCAAIGYHGRYLEALLVFICGSLGKTVAYELGWRWYAAKGGDPICYSELAYGFLFALAGGLAAVSAHERRESKSDNSAS